MKVLIVCTGNSCRSPMAAAFLQSLDQRLFVASAGIKPETKVNHFAVKATHEMLLEISTHQPTALNFYNLHDFDQLILLCEKAKQLIDLQKLDKQAVHYLPLPDPADTTGDDAFLMNTYRNCRDEIKNEIFKLYINHLKPKLK